MAVVNNLSYRVVKLTVDESGQWYFRECNPIYGATIPATQATTLNRLANYL